MTSAVKVEGRQTAEKEMGAAIAALTDLDREALCAKWKAILRSNPPAHLSRWLLFRILAYRMQAAAFGDLDRASIRLLNQIADEREERIVACQKLGKKPPKVPPVPAKRMRPGTILLREHNQQIHRVTVTATGYSWNEKSYRSLTEVAFAITGTRWNGPRFFGLRTKRQGAEDQQL